jgi:hypothetical protein
MRGTKSAQIHGHDCEFESTSFSVALLTITCRRIKEHVVRAPLLKVFIIRSTYWEKFFGQ